MNLLCERVLSRHYYSLELPDWFCNTKDVSIICEAYEYHRGGKYKCFLSDKEYPNHFKLEDKELKNILKFYHKNVKGE